MKKEQKPIIIQQDLEKIAQFYTAIEERIPMNQQIVDAYRNTGFYDPKVGLSFLIMNHENLKSQHTLKLIREKLPTDSELKLRESEAIKVYEVSTPELDSAIAQVIAHSSETGVNHSYFGIKNDKVVVNVEAVEKYTARFTIFAETEAEIQTLKLFNSFIKAATTLNGHLKENRIDTIFLHRLHPLQISRWLVMEDDKYKIKPQVFQRIKRQLASLEPKEAK